MRKSEKGSQRRLGSYITLALALSVAISPAILTSQFGIGFSPILTGSMSPSAEPGDLYITKITTVSQLAIGDVIAINSQESGLFYSHRIVEIRNLNGLLRITTQGDANTTADRDLFIASKNAAVSRVIYRVPELGRPLVYLNTVQGRQSAASLLVVANLLALFIFLFRKRIVSTFLPERVYKDLYSEERHSSEQYRLLIHSLQESLAIERENNEKAGSHK
jgi:signal peptidase